MADATERRHIEATPGVVGGKARISGTRISVRDVAFWHERLGLSADEIATEHDLTLADVYAALAYYFDHREEIDRDAEEARAFVEALRRQNPSWLPGRLADR